MILMLQALSKSFMTSTQALHHRGSRTAKVTNLTLKAAVVEYRLQRKQQNSKTKQHNSTVSTHVNHDGAFHLFLID